MNILYSILLGIIQGVAEFLPISSSGHLVLFQTFFAFKDTDSMLFNVLLHLGTLVSVCIYYRKDIWEMIREFFQWIAALIHRDGKEAGRPTPARRMIVLIIVATLPLFVVVPVKKWMEATLSTNMTVSVALLITGCLLYFSDRMAKGHKNAKTATVVDALVVGAAQAVGTIPGISRSGITISAGLFRGFDRKFAVRFSFLMSLPAVLGANVLEIGDAVAQGIDPKVLPVYLIGVAVAAVVGYLSIRLVSLLSDKGKFGMFAYYCWVVGLGSLIAGIIVPLFSK
ncbi:undecaprenyl-diphosphate phosphatase [Pseudoflavonifractor sp. MSJ-37]|uniref:undecaprenyl-diphosphate phosphatase n=1 Tax=Pseudoflavonifractor sp. MSJ-37 TaxID=2841531 RepID=UPI0020A13C25|nr:undecaprenyl-diphosphate phosphatase [Pseudoflavonifractor sp. MSJ-37]